MLSGASRLITSVAAAAMTGVKRAEAARPAEIRAKDILNAGISGLLVNCDTARAPCAHHLGGAFPARGFFPMPCSLRSVFASAPKVDCEPSCYTRAAAFYPLMRPRAPF